MCLDDLWQWLSGTFEAHPISGFGFSFLVIYGTVDEFSLSADMFHNCQNFDWSGISEKKIIKEEKNQGSFTTFLLSCAHALNCCDWSLQPHPVSSRQLADLPVPSPCAALLICAFSGPDGKSCWQWRLGECFPALPSAVSGVHPSSGAGTDTIKLLPLSSRWCALCGLCVHSTSQRFFGCNVSSPGLWLLWQPRNLLLCLEAFLLVKPRKVSQGWIWSLYLQACCGCCLCLCCTPVLCVYFLQRKYLTNCLLFSLLCPSPPPGRMCPSSQAASTHSAFCIFLRFCLCRWGHFKKVDGKSRLMINLLWCKKLLKYIRSRSLENVHEGYTLWKKYPLIPFSTNVLKCPAILFTFIHATKHTQVYTHTPRDMVWTQKSLRYHLLKTHWHLLSPFCCLDEDILLITFCQDLPSVIRVSNPPAQCSTTVSTLSVLHACPCSSSMGVFPVSFATSNTVFSIVWVPRLFIYSIYRSL